MGVICTCNPCKFPYIVQFVTCTVKPCTLKNKNKKPVKFAVLGIWQSTHICSTWQKFQITKLYHSFSWERVHWSCTYVCLSFAALWNCCCFIFLFVGILQFSHPTQLVVMAVYVLVCLYFHMHLLKRDRSIVYYPLFVKMGYLHFLDASVVCLCEVT